LAEQWIGARVAVFELKCQAYPDITPVAPIRSAPEWQVRCAATAGRPVR
jgi:hypothetical protein